MSVAKRASFQPAFKSAFDVAFRNAFNPAGGGVPPVVANYFLRQTFTGGDVSLSNGNTLTGPGEGGTFESSDADDTGTLTLQLGTGQTADITSNRLVMVSGSAGGGFVGPQVTRAAGLCMKWKAEFDNNHNAGAISGGFGFNQDATQAGGTWEAVVIFADMEGASGDAVGELRLNVGSDSFTVGGDGLLSNDTEYNFAVVLGGFTSGVPDAAGTEGCHAYWYNGVNWELIAATPTGSANPYPKFRNFTSSSVPNDLTFDDIILPDSSTVVDGVFTPTGYVLDTFTDADDTLITAHTSDSGHSWEVSTDTAGMFSIRSNRAACSLDSTIQAMLVDAGEADVFISAFLGNTGNNPFCGIAFRASGYNDNFHIAKNGANIVLNERTGGTQTQRAAVSVGATDEGTVNIRCAGDLLEAWFLGGNKMSYTTSVRNTVTKHGFYSFSTGSATANYIDDLLILPLTSADYDAALDSF